MILLPNEAAPLLTEIKQPPSNAMAVHGTDKSDYVLAALDADQREFLDLGFL